MEKILNSRTFRRKLQYLVQWEGYGIEHNSWEDADNVHADELIQEFHQNNPGAPRRIRAAIFGTIPFQPITVSHASSRCMSEGGVTVRGTPFLDIPITLNTPEVTPLLTKASSQCPIHSTNSRPYSTYSTYSAYSNNSHAPSQQLLYVPPHKCTQCR